MAETEKGLGLCSQHGTHCKAIEYLESGQDRLQESIRNSSVDLKSAKESIAHDLERIKDSNKSTYVTKTEFEPIKKLVYGLAGLMLAYALKMIML